MKRLIPLVLSAALLAGAFGLYLQYDPSPGLSCGELLYTALTEQRSRILLAGYDLTPEELSAEWNAVLYGNPDLFFTEDRYEYVTAGDRVLYVIPQYAVTGEALEEARREYAQGLEAILATTDPDWSDLETALYLHDYLCMHYAYDEELSDFTAYRMLTEGTGVCRAYTLLYTALLNACGIETGYVISSDMNHAWNTVTLDGQVYNVDVTYDDPTPDRAGRAVHTNFLVSDRALSETHSFTQEEGLGQCTDTTYDNGLWQSADSAFVPWGDSFYYIAKGTVRRWDGGSASTAVHTISATWFTDRGDGSYWQGCFSSLWSLNGRLLYNTPDRIMALNPNTGATYTLYTYRGEGSIYGFACTDDLLILQIADSPNASGRLVEVSLP